MIAEIQKETTVINLFGGPGSGKTTCAWEIASVLKKAGQSVEYVPEYAKELVWDNDLETLKDQRHIYSVQSHRVDRLVGKTDYIVTDSPILLTIIYDIQKSAELAKEALLNHASKKSFNIFINRGDTFEKAGRVHDLEQSKALDRQIISMLRKNGIGFVFAEHENILDVMNNYFRSKANENKSFEMGMGTGSLGNDRTQYYKYFYSGEQDQEASAFQKETGWHKIWASDSQGMNGDTWILYRSIPDLPNYLQDYAKGQEKIEEMVDLQAERAIDAHQAEYGADGFRAFPGSFDFEPEL